MKKVALMGNGGFAKEVAEIVRLNGYSVAACFGEKDTGFDAPYRGAQEDLGERFDDYDAVVLAIGAINRRTLSQRKALADWMNDKGIPSIPVVSPHAVLANGVEVEPGAIVAHGAMIGIDATIRSGAVINMGAIVGHDVLVSERAIIAPGAFVGGGACIGSDTILGPHSRILQGLSVGDDVILGIGCTALKSLPDGATVWPHPSAVMKK